MIDYIIKTETLNIWYHHLHAIKDTSVELPKNQITALIGASGSGKSTFLRSLNRMLDVIPVVRITGKILFNHEDILNPQTDAILLRRKIGMVFQNPIPFAKSIYDNVSYGLEVQGISKKSGGLLDAFRNKKKLLKGIESSKHPLDIAVVKSLKEVVLWDEVKERLHHSALGLSGGQQQRLCIARMISVRPEILLLDEPCSALDPISTRKIEELLLKLKKNYSIIIVTHNMNQARRISDYTGFFHMGSLVEFGKTKQMFEHPNKQITKDYVHGAFG